MALDSDDHNHLLAEVIQGIGPDGSALPDTAEVRQARATLVAEVAELRRLGVTPDVHTEFPAFEKATPVSPA